MDVAVSSDGAYLYVADDKGHNIRRVTVSTGEVIPFAGSGIAGAVDATGTAASFNHPQGVALSADGAYLYVAEQENHKIRTVATGYNAPTTSMYPEMYPEETAAESLNGAGEAIL